jgi:hypothetical protein
MRCASIALTVGCMLNPTIRNELVRAAEADLARKLRHAHHTRNPSPTVLASWARRVRVALLKRKAQARSVAPARNLGSAADATKGA